MSGILLDTHTFLWWSLSPEKLPPKVIEAISDSSTRIMLSVASCWEAQIKLGLGELSLSIPLKTVVEREIRENCWEILQVCLAHTWKLESLPPLHKDPFDRMLVAQALVEDLIIATKDPLVSIYPTIRSFWD